MATTLKKLLEILSRSERRRALLLLAMIFVMALLDLVGVASIMPFMAVLSRPQLIHTNAILSHAYNFFEFRTDRSFLIFLGVIVFVLMLISIAFKAFTTYAQNRFVLMRGYSISLKLVANYLNQPYVWFLNRNSADLGNTILSEVMEVVNTSLTPMLQLIAQSIVVFTLVILIITVDPWLSLVTAAILALSYLIAYKSTSTYLGRIGKQRSLATQTMWNTLTEAFGGIKEIKLGRLEKKYIRKFDDSLLLTVKTKSAVQTISQIPKFILEAIVFGGVILLLIYLINVDDGLVKALPVISMYAFAIYRLMPALQLVFTSLTQLKFANAALERLHSDLINLNIPHVAKIDSAELILEKNISLKNVSFVYPNSSQPALKDLWVTFPAKSTVGIVGATGSGKTTLVDLILGLLEPTSGRLEVDNILIDENNRHNWQRNIGYVPQQIYLADDSISANIAFGVETSLIDQDAVERAAKIANLHDFVRNELPNGYETKVGERGVRLSGGQRQRIGIARALYFSPMVLILDEATSALDNLTERAVMDAVHNLGGELTIILIAHRLTTVRECNQIYIMKRGEITAQGTYDELMKFDEGFKAMNTQVG